MTSASSPDDHGDREAASSGDQVDAARRSRFRWLLAVGLVGAIVILGVGAWVVYGFDESPGTATTGDEGSDMSAMGEAPADAPQIPPVAGLYDGEQILFVHTETSDPDIADALTSMMGSPVIVVPALADVPESALAEVYVFTNGIQPDGPRGPLGYQRDVFDSVPGDDAYRPLRSVRFVTWDDAATPRLLGGVDDIRSAVEAGEVSVETPGIVVNMPITDWPTGRR